MAELLPCPVCAKPYDDQRDLDAHVATHGVDRQGAPISEAVRVTRRAGEPLRTDVEMLARIDANLATIKTAVVFLAVVTAINIVSAILLLLAA